MRAITYDQYGETDVLKLTEQSVPKVGPGEVLVRVRSAGVNPVDWKIMQGHLDPLLHTWFPVTPGWDVAGVAEQVGLDTPEFTEGDEVIGYARRDMVHDGTFAEFACVPVRALAKKPAALDWNQAAGLPLAGLTAYQTHTRLGLREGETVLIHNGAGGLGVHAVQIARSLGARVIATASEKNHDWLRGFGAEPVTYGEGLTERVKELAPSGADVVADFIGGVVDITQAVLKSDGRHATIIDPAVKEIGGSHFWVRPSSEDLQVLARMADAGQLTVPVAHTFPLERAAEAFELSQTGHVNGKLTLEVS